MNRRARRAVEALRRRNGDPDAAAPDRATLLRYVAALAENDATVSGATIFMPDGRVQYIDAATLRRGGHA